MIWKRKQSCRGMLPSENKVCRWWKRKTVCFKLDALNFWRNIGHLTRRTTRIWPSLDPKNCWTNSLYNKNEIELRSKRPNLQYCRIQKKLHTSKKTKCISQKYTKRKRNCWTRFPSTSKLRDDGTENPYISHCLLL